MREGSVRRDSAQERDDCRRAELLAICGAFAIGNGVKRASRARTRCALERFEGNLAEHREGLREHPITVSAGKSLRAPRHHQLKWQRDARAGSRS